MGETADMMLNGILCEACGAFVSEKEVGYPQYCCLECAKDSGAGKESVVK